MPDRFTEQIKKLEALRHVADAAALEEFDEEAEQLILQKFGEATNHLEAYELAMMGEAETIVNMPQAAQEDATQDLFHKSIEQRRQVLEGCLADVMVAVVRPANRPASPPPALKPTRKAAKNPRAATKKKKPVKKKAGAVKKASKKSGKKKPVKKKKPAVAGKKKSGPARKKRAKRK
jgi:hypothetical protein